MDENVSRQLGHTGPTILHKSKHRTKAASKPLEERTLRPRVLTLSQIKGLIEQEERSSADILYLTANEPQLSPEARRVLSSPLGSRYLLEHISMRGDSPSRLNGFMFRGLDGVNAIEKSAIEVCRQLFGADYVEFRCLSGLHAMQVTLVSLTKPGDKIMRVATKDGGHFATQNIVRLFGRQDCCYVFDRSRFQLDLEQTRRVFDEEKPVVLYIDAMNYLFPFPLAELRRIAGDVPIVYDASHTLGLIAGGQFQNPLAEGADILQGNTHKTFPGPQKGIILGNNRALMEKISYNLSQGLVSSQHTASTLALFIALHEMFLYGKEYAEKTVENAKYLAEQLHRRGFRIVAADHGFTRNHQFFIDVTELGPGPSLLQKLLQANIAVNRTIPFEHVDALRIGVQEITRLGYGRPDLDRIAGWFEEILLRGRDLASVKEEVSNFVRSKTKVLFCEDKAPDEQPIEVSHDTPSDKPRWISISLERGDSNPDLETLESIRTLGAAASTFKQQTDSAGNVSTRISGRVFITATGCYIKKIEEKDLVEITGHDGSAIRCKGHAQPSSEAYMHNLIYLNTKSNFVVHTHYMPSDEEIRRLGIEVVPPEEYASVALAESVADACMDSNIVYVQGHGLILHGNSLEDCIELLGRFTGDER
ncbi:MAG: fluorothreonine transaldolase [Candidatus Micrarchaeota archaeon]